MSDSTDINLADVRRVRLEALNQAVIHAINTGSSAPDGIVKTAGLFEQFILNGKPDDEEDEDAGHA